MCTGLFREPAAFRLEPLVAIAVDGTGGRAARWADTGVVGLAVGLTVALAPRKSPQGQREARLIVSPSRRARRVGKRPISLHPQSRSTGPTEW